MRMRDVLEIFRENECNHESRMKSRERYEDLHAYLGVKAKEAYNILNLNVIDDADLGSIIVDIVADAYSSQGLPRPDFLEAMYSAGLEDGDLARAKIRAETRKLNAQAALASAKD